MPISLTFWSEIPPPVSCVSVVGVKYIFTSQEANSEMYPPPPVSAVPARIGFFFVSQDKKETSRKQIKEAKNRSKKIRGTGRRIAKHKAKKAAK